MSDFLRRIIDLVYSGHVQISAHGYDEMIEDGILAGDVIDSLVDAIVVEDYPAYPKGPCPKRPDFAGRARHCLSAGSQPVE